mgnify:CR=1 FL=1
MNCEDISAPTVAVGLIQESAPRSNNDESEV